MKAQCTTSDYRRIRRWEHEEVMDKAQQRLDRMPEAMTIRKSTVEHVFGTLKHWMGWTHFLTRGIRNVATEMSLSGVGVAPLSRRVFGLDLKPVQVARS